MLFLETMVLFCHYAYYGSLSYSNIWLL